LPIYAFHGGGFIYGTLDSEDATCSRIVAAMDILIVSISYRHASQHPFPAARHDVLDEFHWFVENAEAFRGDVGNVIMDGISAGANLAAVVALTRNAALSRKYENDEDATIKGLVLDMPWLVINKEKLFYQDFSSKEKLSRVQCAEAPVLFGRVL
jgi:acetyl esterase/lipase